MGCERGRRTIREWVVTLQRRRLPRRAGIKPLRVPANPAMVGVYNLSWRCECHNNYATDYPSQRMSMRPRCREAKSEAMKECPHARLVSIREEISHGRI